VTDLVSDSHKITPTGEIWINKIKMKKWLFFIRCIKLE